MKRCVKCGQFIEDDEIICSNCEFEESQKNGDYDSDIIKLGSDDEYELDEVEESGELEDYDENLKRNNKWRKGVLVKRNGKRVGRNSKDSKFGWGMVLVAVLFGVFLVVNAVTSTNNILSGVLIVTLYWFFLIFYIAALYMADEGRIVFTANAGDETFMLLASILLCITSFIGWDTPLHPANYVLFVFAGICLIGSLIISVVYNSGDILGMIVSVMAKIFVTYFTVLLIAFFVVLFVVFLILEIIFFWDDYYDRRYYYRRWWW